MPNKTIEKIKAEYQEHLEHHVKLLAPRAAKAALAFFTRNRDLIFDTVKEIAFEMAGAKGEDKRKVALERIGESIPDVKFSLSWLNFALELAVIILKAQKII